jgi:mannosyltransferase OCH1-like enzyme
MNKNNQTWTFHLCDNRAQLQFMNDYYPNTSLLWAYKQIHPSIGNSAADIWRYAVLYQFGGLYLDDDAMLDWSFSEVPLPGVQRVRLLVL